MKNNLSKIIVFIVAFALAFGGFALFHKSKTPTPAATSSTSSQSTAAAVNNAVLTTKTNASVGAYLTDASGNTLYTYGADSTGVSNCTGSCLSTWPAYQDKGATTGLPTNVSTLSRSDNGQTQYTYKGKPLYTFSGDSQGQVTGNGVADFQVAKP